MQIGSLRASKTLCVGNFSTKGTVSFLILVPDCLILMIHHSCQIYTNLLWFVAVSCIFLSTFVVSTSKTYWVFFGLCTIQTDTFLLTESQSITHLLYVNTIIFCMCWLIEYFYILACKPFQSPHISHKTHGSPVP